MTRFIRALFTRPKPNAARELALMGVQKRRATVRETARQIRAELGLPDDGRLA